MLGSFTGIDLGFIFDFTELLTDVAGLLTNATAGAITGALRLTICFYPVVGLIVVDEGCTGTDLTGSTALATCGATDLGTFVV